MAIPASRTVPSSPNPSAQGSPRTRDWSSLRTSEPGSAFRGISGRGRGGRGGGVRSSRGGGHPPNNSSQKGGSLPESTNRTPSPSRKISTIPRKPPVLPAITVSDKSVNGATEPGDRPKAGSRKEHRATTPSPSETSKTAPPTPSRSTARRRRAQSGKGSTAVKPPSLTATTAVKSQKSRIGSTPSSQTILRKDVPPHLAAAHEAEIRHDIDALVERVRAVAMAENRPTTPGSHIDWARDEDDSLPDLDDWGITTTHTNKTRAEDESEEISPILTDTLRPLPEPNSDAHENEREMETYDAQPERVGDLPTQSSSPPVIVFEKAPEQCIIGPTAVEESSSPTLPNGELPLHPSLPDKSVAATESLHARDGSISKASSFPPKPPIASIEGDSLTNKSEGLLAGSIHVPSADELSSLQRVSSAPSSERGLAASIHAHVPGLPESHSAPPSLLTDSSSAPRTHARSQTEGRLGSHQSHTASPAPVSHRHGRSGASSPLGKHVYTHSRNRSTPAGGSRAPQAARPVITGDAISKLARTIGGLAPAVPRTQTIPVTKDSTISS